jgi:hypothetical protein
MIRLLRPFTVSAFGATLIDDTNASAARTTLELAASHALGASLVSITDPAFGAVGDGSTDDRAAWALAIAAATAAKSPILVTGGPYHIGSSLTITVPIVDTVNQVFSTTSAVTLSANAYVRPEWFGSAAGNIRLAVNALPATGGVVQLRNARYAPSFVDYTTATTGYLAKTGVTLQGAGRPSIKSDGTTFLDGTGTIIDGPFFVAAQSFHAFDLGIDSGSAVCTARYSGTAQEGFFPSYYASGAATYHSDVVVERVSALCKDQASAVHAILFEQVDGGVINDVLVQYGFHGVVIKSRNVNARGIIARENGGEGLILKSDNYAELVGVNVSDVICTSNDTTQDAGYGVLIEAVSTAGAGVNLSNVRVYKKAYGITIRSNGATMADVAYSNVTIEGCLYGVYLGGALLRTQGRAVIINNATDGLTVESGVADTSSFIDGLGFTNVTTAIKASGVIAVDNVSFNTVTTGFSYVAPGTTSRIKVGQWYATSLTNVHDLSTAFVNSWANSGGGNETFKLIPCNGGIKIAGLIVPGTNALITTLPVCVRPSQNMRFVGLGYNGAAYAPIEIILGSNGTLNAVNYTAGSTYVSLDGAFFLPDRE